MDDNLKLQRLNHMVFHKDCLYIDVIGIVSKPCLPEPQQNKGIFTLTFTIKGKPGWTRMHVPIFYIRCSDIDH